MKKLRTSARHLSRGVWLVLFAVVSIAVVVLAVLALRPLPEGLPVLVTTRDIAAGEAVERASVAVIRVTPKAVPRDSLTDPGEALGHRPILPLPAGTVLTENLVGTTAQSLGIPPGYAQTVVVVSPSTAFVQPGDKVEIWGIDSACDIACDLTRVAEDASVISVDELSSGTFGSEPPVSVALMVRATEVGDVLRSAEGGYIHFVLR